MWSIILYIVAVTLYGLLGEFPRLHEATRSSGTVADWLLSAWPLFLWAILIQAVFSIKTGRKHARIVRWKQNLSLCTMAGVFEEVIYRWLLFMIAIVGIQFANFIFGGFAGFELIAWLHNNLLGPIANWFTLGYLEEWLFHDAGWFVGAALIVTNGMFRNGHEYQGIIGYTNSWFIGMFLFWMMFQYGLVAAIVAHVSYNALIVATVYLLRPRYRPKINPYLPR